MSQRRYVADDMADADWDSDLATDDVAVVRWRQYGSLIVGPARKKEPIKV